MAVETYVGRARERTRSEREALAAKVEALDRFADRVADVSPATSRRSGTGMMTTTGPQVGTGTDDACRAVRTAFAETVRPHSVADVEDPEPLVATIRSEFTDSIAVALAPTTDASFTDDLKRAIVSETRDRKTEAETLLLAVDREREALEEAEATVETVTSWIAAADETPLPELGFEELRGRHETLSAHRERCEELAEKRQSFLSEATSKGAEAGVRNREVVPFLYRDFPVDHPVLATVARLEAVCRECQRAVRAHLTRRG